MICSHCNQTKKKKKKTIEVCKMCKAGSESTYSYTLEIYIFLQVYIIEVMHEWPTYFLLNSIINALSYQYEYIKCPPFF